MRKWYCVITTFDDRGNVTANIVDAKETERRPEGTYETTARKDIYTDWFDSKEAANEYITDCKNGI